MAQAERKNPPKANARRHGTGDLYGEWPTPADVVQGFSGDPNKAEDKQWQTHDHKPRPE